MLILVRKKGEGIVINDNIQVTVVAIRGDKIRLGIQAPREIPVHRQEVYDRIQQALSQPKLPPSLPEPPDEPTSPPPPP